MQHLLTAMTDREETMDQEVREGDEGMEGDDSDDSIHYEDVDTEEEASGEEEEEEGAEEGEEEEGDPDGPPQTYLPGKPLEEGEELVCDENAYIMYHQANTGITPRL